VGLDSADLQPHHTATAYYERRCWTTQLPLPRQRHGFFLAGCRNFGCTVHAPACCPCRRLPARRNRRHSPFKRALIPPLAHGQTNPTSNTPFAGQAPALRQAYDVAIARAVAELRVLAELCLPLVRPGGHWVAAKGAAPQEEADQAGAAIGKLGGKLLGIEEVDSGGWCKAHDVRVCFGLFGWVQLCVCLCGCVRHAMRVWDCVASVERCRLRQLLGGGTACLLPPRRHNARRPAVL